MTAKVGSSQALTMGLSAGPARAVTLEGCPPDFRSIFDHEFSYVWTSLRRLGVPPRDLEDITHDVFVEVFRNLDRYDPTRPLRPWLFAFAFRFASDYRRLARHRVEVYEEHAGTSADPPADDVVAARELRALIATALESIDMVRRGVFILHELDARPMAEIADALGIPLNTAYSRLRVAREEFTTTFRMLQRGGT
jgi:RNA polymerase sigma-70 factor (ECF subfamily)